MTVQLSSIETKGFKQLFFSTYLEFEPEEGSTLGLSLGATYLRDMSTQGLEKRNEFFKGYLDRLRSLPKGDPELLIMRALCEAEVRSFERGDHLTNLEWSLYPYTMISYQIAHGADPSGRARKVKQYLENHEANLKEGLRKGSSPYRGIVEFLVKYQLPPVIEFMGRINTDAADAYARHLAFLEEKVLPESTKEFAIGREEYEWRLKNVLMVSDSIDSLIARASKFLKESEGEFIALAGARSLKESTAKVQTLQQNVEVSQEYIKPRYQKILESSIEFIRRHQLFHLPDDLSIGMDEYPEGLRMMGAGTNWPAPIFDKKAKGQFVLNPDPAAHSRPWQKVLSIHEGIPGHFLQSRMWQEAFRNEKAPIRFLLVADDVAIPRQYFGAMTNIEGYAVYAEELMLEKGFHQTQEEKLFALTAHRIRAARVIVDAGLHSRTMSDEQAAKIFEDEIGLPGLKARMEIERYKRAPLQALSYFVGFQQILELREKYLAKNSSASLAEFHRWFFSFGPVPPGLMEI